MFWRDNIANRLAGDGFIDAVIFDSLGEIV